MHIINVDPVGSEAPEARFRRLDDVGARAARAGDRVAHLAEFGRQHDSLAALAERGAEKLLRLAVTPIDVGSIEEGDAEPDRLVDDAPRPLEIATPAAIVAA